eukprot:4875-Heterococcus_DN1.PRE.1
MAQVSPQSKQRRRYLDKIDAVYVTKAERAERAQVAHDATLRSAAAAAAELQELLQLSKRRGLRQQELFSHFAGPVNASYADCTALREGMQQLG